MAKITTLIPTFRRPKLLQRALESVVNQTFKDILIYVFDNASQDETAHIVKLAQQKDTRIKYVYREQNIGLFQNFSKALEQVQTPFFHFFSDDDYLLPWFYETALKGFDKHPDAGVSICTTLLVYRKGNTQFTRIDHPFEGYYPPPHGLLKLISNRVPLWTGFVFRKELLESVGTLNSRIGTLFDIEFSLLAACHFPIVAHKQPGALFFYWEGSSSSQLGEQLSWPNYAQMNRNILKQFKATTPFFDQIKDGLEKTKIRSERSFWIQLLYQKKLDAAAFFKKTLIEQKNAKEARLLSQCLWIYLHFPIAAIFARECFSLISFFRKGIHTLRFKCYLQKQKKLKHFHKNILENWSDG